MLHLTNPCAELKGSQPNWTQRHDPKSLGYYITIFPYMDLGADTQLPWLGRPTKTCSVFYPIMSNNQENLSNWVWKMVWTLGQVHKGPRRILRYSAISFDVIKSITDWRRRRNGTSELFQIIKIFCLFLKTNIWFTKVFVSFGVFWVLSIF